MGWNIALVQVRASPRATPVAVRDVIERHWLARGATIDPRNPLRLPRFGKRPGRIGYVIVGAADWIAVSDSDNTTTLAKPLADELATTTCEYHIVESAAAATLRWHGPDDEPPIPSRAVLDRAAEFPNGAFRCQDALDWSRTDRDGVLTLGFQHGRAAADPPEQAIWAPLERGDGHALATALASPHAAGALARADLSSPPERAAIATLDLRSLAAPLLLALAGRAVVARDDELYARVIDRLPITVDTARLVTQQLWSDEAPLAALEAWVERLAPVLDARLHELWISLWLRVDALDRAVDQVERALACGLDLAKFRDGGGGVPSPHHKQLTRSPRYRALLKR